MDDRTHRKKTKILSNIVGKGNIGVLTVEF